jgi:uncharacterized membrane protein YfcA
LADPALFPFDVPVAAALVLGALAAGFVTGLAGFGTALVALAFWLHVVEPGLAGPLVAICAVAAQLTAVRVIWRGMRWPRLWPMLAGGATGLPVGVWALDHLPSEGLRAGVGVVLVTFSLYNMLRGRLRVPRFGGRTADGSVGLAGGILGGAAGLAGVLPTLWCAMRGWPADEQRGVYQPYTLAVLALAIPAHAAAGSLGAEVLAAAVLTAPPALLGGWLGIACYGRLDERQFRLVVLWLLLASGLLLLPDALSGSPQA